jgi:hypothetical protein
MSWRERLIEFKLNASLEANDPENLIIKRATASSKDQGIYNDNGAGVFVRKNNSIDIYAKEGLGITVNHDLDSVTVYASKLNFYTSSIDFNVTSPFGIRYNKMPLNLTAAPLGTYMGAGTLLPFSTASLDATKYVQKILGIGGLFNEL